MQSTDINPCVEIATKIHNENTIHRMIFALYALEIIDNKNINIINYDCLNTYLCKKG